MAGIVEDIVVKPNEVFFLGRYSCGYTSVHGANERVPIIAGVLFERFAGGAESQMVQIQFRKNSNSPRRDYLNREMS